ncbi:HAD-IA family hydrolase [uncultured Ruegeria sp.]|uniref:HAD-IA family hydrolase n=1 Tax=uncultured Ruegeria sp. TaxID=259304 RepID=UPI00345B89D6
MLESALLKRPRPVLVGNPDIVAPRENGFSSEPGLFAHRLADRTGVVPEFFGKPFGNIFELAFKRLGSVDKSRVLMVGDSLHTDILGARAAGIASALVSGYGFFAGHDIEDPIQKAGIVPDIVVTRPLGLSDAARRGGCRAAPRRVGNYVAGDRRVRRKILINRPVL